MRRVLLVDDDLDVLEALSTALEVSYDVVVAHDASEALEQLGRAPTSIDAIVLDLMMPGMGTREFLGECAARDLAVPVIAASARQDIAQRCADLGIERWVQKPFRIATLLARLDAACRGERE